MSTGPFLIRAHQNIIPSGSRQRRDSDQDTPAIEFTYEDRDSYLKELSELYSYSEVPEFQTTMDLFHTSLESLVGTRDWDKTTTAQKRDFVMVMVNRFEVSWQIVQGHLRSPGPSP